MAKKTIVTGYRELDRKLATLPLKVQKAVTRGSLRKAGKMIQDKAKQNLTSNQSVETGELRKGIRVRASKRSRTRVGIYISTTERKEENSKWPFGGAQVEFGREDVRPKPFLRPAGYESQQAIRAFFVADVKRQLDLLSMGLSMKWIRDTDRLLKK